MNLILALLVIFGGMSYPVVQQDCPLCVSPNDGVFTEFAMARHDGSTGLLAHDYLSGGDLFALEVGDRIEVVFTDQTVTYRLGDILRVYQQNAHKFGYNGLTMSAEEVFSLAYGSDNTLTLQTCDGNYRVFFVAHPIKVRNVRLH